MGNEEFREIPGYDYYGVSNDGRVYSFERELILGQYLLDGYVIVDTFRGSLTETLPVHRAVALAWVANCNPQEYTIVNHKDGNRLNNWWQNLEWTNYSGNNYHAVNTGLRPDNIPCRVRDFYTGSVHEFSSMAQAAEFMGMRKDSSVRHLCPKMFGKLVADRYEFRFADDPTPWFYEGRTELVSPSRYMVVVREADGTTKEIYSNRALLKDYQLYGSPNGKSIPALAEYGNQVYPDKEFKVRDSYAAEQFRMTRQTKASEAVAVRAFDGKNVRDFGSLTQCANHFSVDRSSISSRLNNGKQLDGWTFTQLPL